MTTAPEAKGRWNDSDEGRAHVVRLLMQSGTPLELDVAIRCQRFASLHRVPDTLHTRASRLIYGSGFDQPAREIDQSVSLYSEMELSDHIGLQFEADVLIECKHRQSAELFGFALPEGRRPGSAFVVGSDLAPSQLVRSIAPLGPDYMRDEWISVVAMLTGKDGTLSKVEDENLIYKSAASLFDFIEFSLIDSALTTMEDVDPEDRLGLLHDFDTFIHERGYSPEYVVRRWLVERSAEIAYEFASMYSNRRVHHMVHTYFPVICMDSPLCRVDVDSFGAPVNFTDAKILLAGARISGWPGRFRPRVAITGPEAVVTVCNPEGLSDVLVAIEAWFRRAVSVLKAQPAELVERCLLEAALISTLSTRAAGAQSGRFQSDLDLEVDYPMSP